MSKCGHLDLPFEDDIRMPISTIGVGAAVTPTVVKTYISHVRYCMATVRLPC